MTVTTYTKDVLGNELKFPIKFDDNLVEEIKFIPDWIDDKYDYWLLMVGRNGEGKSYMAMRIATLLNRNFDLDNIVFTADDVEKAVEKASIGEVILFDESDEIARHGSSAIIQEFKRFAKRIRHKRLIIILATPTLKDINWYFISRIRSVIYSFADGINRRGYYNYYTGEDQLAWLYFMAKDQKVETKTFVYDKALSTIKNGYIGVGDKLPFQVDDDEYNSRKLEATLRAKESNILQRDVKKLRLKYVSNWLDSRRLHDAMNQTMLANLLGVSEATIRGHIQDIEGRKDKEN